MNKRIRRRVHKRYLSEVVYEISISDPWREVLFAAELYTKHVVDQHHLSIDKFKPYIRFLLTRYRLRYYVSPVPNDNIPGWETGYEGCLMFKFEAAEFPEIVDYSANSYEWQQP